jgi:hypothetical protein
MSVVYHDVEQRTPEWDLLRAGRLTASLAPKLVTPTGKPSIQYKAEIGRIIAEQRGLQPPEFLKPTYWMDRGTNMEAEALAWFEVETDLIVHPVGFVTSGCDLIGGSPDGIIRLGDGSMIPLELKVPKPATHITRYLAGGLPKDHIGQVHYQMALCEAPYAYYASYSPNVAPLILKVMWSEYTDTMVKAFDLYRDEFRNAIKILDGVEDEI